MTRWAVRLAEPWPHADDPYMTVVVDTERRGQAIAQVLTMAQDAGYRLRFIDFRVRKAAPVDSPAEQ